MINIIIKKTINKKINNIKEIKIDLDKLIEVKFKKNNN